MHDRMDDEADWGPLIDRSVDESFDDAVTLRRHLHQHPEPSGEEQQTSLHLYQLLSNRFETQMGPDGRGVLVDFAHPGPTRGTIAIRGDIDALRIHESDQVPFRSTCDGLMHACGHDVHTAVVYCALNAIRAVAAELPCGLRVRGIFQPAEETSTGAREMIDVGAIEGVDSILATHVDPTRRVGAIGLREGVLTANCDEVSVTIVGLGGHAARPHESTDPIAAAAQFISAVYQFIPRSTDSQEAVVVTFGQIQAGDNANVIPEEVRLRGTLRTLDERVRDDTIAHLRRIAAGVAQTTETSIGVDLGLGCHSVVNCPQLTRLLHDVGGTVLGESGVERIARPSMGSEDFAYYLKHIRGAMFRLGCASERVGSAGLHTPQFNPDEEAIRLGARILARTVITWSKRPT